MDFSEEVFSYVARYDSVTSPADASHFVADAPDLLLHYPAALQAARDWLWSEEGERLAFYSANEGADPGPQPKPKRHTTAQLAEQISHLVGLIPALSQQVQDISARQKAMESKASSPAPLAGPPVPGHQRAFPVPTASPGLPSNPLRCLTGLLGPPPKTRAPVLHPTQPVQDLFSTKAWRWMWLPESR